jgi:hypothetical protein
VDESSAIGDRKINFRRKYKPYFCGNLYFKMLKKLHFCVFAFLFAFLSVQAQSSLAPTPEKYSKYLSVTPNYGMVWKHHKYLDSILPNANPRGLEINIGWQTTGRKSWQQVQNYPR